MTSPLPDGFFTAVDDDAVHSILCRRHSDRCIRLTATEVGRPRLIPNMFAQLCQQRREQNDDFNDYLTVVLFQIYALCKIGR